MPPVGSPRRGLPRDLSGLIDACLRPEAAARPELSEVLRRLNALSA